MKHPVLSDEPVKPITPCCDTWDAALKDGTGDYGDGAAIGYTVTSEFVLGVVGVPLKFCPWCGQPK